MLHVCNVSRHMCVCSADAWGQAIHFRSTQCLGAVCPQHPFSVKALARAGKFRVILNSEFTCANISSGCGAPSTASKSNSNIQSVTHKFRLPKIRFCVSGTLPSAHTLGHGVAGQTENDVKCEGERWLRPVWQGSHPAHRCPRNAVRVCSGVGIPLCLLWALESYVTISGCSESRSFPPFSSLKLSLKGSWEWCCIGSGTIVPFLPRKPTCLRHLLSTGARRSSIPDDQDWGWYGVVCSHTYATWIHQYWERWCPHRSWSQTHFS